MGRYSHTWTTLLLVGAFLIVMGVACAKAAPTPTPTATPRPAATPTAAPTATPTVTPTPVPRATPTPTPVPEKQPQYGGILQRVHNADSGNWDPFIQTSFSNFDLVGPAYSKLVRKTAVKQPDGSVKYEVIVPDLAKSWTVSADGKTYTFTLYDNIKWHDGTAATAASLLAGLKAIYTTSDRGVYMTRNVASMEAPDAKTITITLKAPQPGFLSAAATGNNPAVPMHLVKDADSLKKVLVGTGAFKLKEYKSGSYFDLEKNPDYFIPGRPYLDGVRYTFILDDSARLAALRAGRVHMNTVSSALTPQEGDILKRVAPRLIQVRFHSLRAQSLVFNPKRPPWTDKRARQAVWLAVDRQKYRDIAQGGVGEFPIGNFFDPELSRSQADIEKLPGFRQPKDADIAEAKRLLAQVGVDRTLTIMLRAGFPLYTTVSTLLQEDLTTLGIKSEIKVVESAAWTNSRRSAATAPMDKPDTTWDFTTFGVLNPLPGPDGLYLHIAPGQETYYWPDSFEGGKIKSLADQMSAATDPAERKRLGRAFEDAVIDVAPFVSLFWLEQYIVIVPELHGYLGQLGSWHDYDLRDIWLER